MTCIAWDGKTLAADRGTWFGDVIVDKSKLWHFRHRGYEAVGACHGMVADTRPIRRWLETLQGEPGKIEESAAVVFVVKLDGDLILCQVHGDLEVTEIDTPFLALGGGGAMAMGALAAGATAVRAVEIAVRYSTCAANGVDSYTFT